MVAGMTHAAERPSIARPVMERAGHRPGRQHDENAADDVEPVADQGEADPAETVGEACDQHDEQAGHEPGERDREVHRGG